MHNNIYFVCVFVEKKNLGTKKTPMKCRLVHHQFTRAVSQRDFPSQFQSNLQKQASMSCKAIFFPPPYSPGPSCISPHTFPHRTRPSMFSGPPHVHTLTPVWLQVCARHIDDQRHPVELHRHNLHSSSLALSLSLSLHLPPTHLSFFSYILYSPTLLSQSVGPVNLSQTHF